MSKKLVFAILASCLALPLAADAPASCSLDLSVQDLAVLVEVPVAPNVTPVEAPKPIEATTCSGDACGCLDIPCNAQCDPGDHACFTQCRRQQLACSICCCTPPEYWPTWVNEYC